jgi:transketolase
MAASDVATAAPAELEMREAFGRGLVALGRRYPKLWVLDADLHTSTKTSLFKQAYPDRFLQVGIAEQNLFGLAAGLAHEGFIPFPCTFASFAARRALDQVAISICYPALNVKIPGSYVGVPTSRAGASHNCLEDIAVMRAMPNLRVADPGDNADLAAIMQAAMETDGPVYFRITRLTLPALPGERDRFEWGRGVILRPGRDVSLFGTGMMSGLCLRAADLLAEQGIEAEVVHLASIKPIDRDLIAESAARTGCAVTAENGTVLGGFGSAVLEVLAETCPVPVRRIGVQDRWIESGGIDELFTEHQMQPADIAAAAQAGLRQAERVRQR